MNISHAGGAPDSRRGVRSGCVAVMILVAATAARSWGQEGDAANRGGGGNKRGVLDTPNPGGVLRTITLDGTRLDTGNPFFQSLGTNGRSCGSCHVASAGWTITPIEVQQRFKKTDGRDPIFRRNDGSNSPHADVSTVAARVSAYSMLLNRAVIRVGLPMPAGAEFELVEVDDPYGFASAAELSLFRRPLPTTNIRFLTGLMWDGRESFGPLGTSPILDDATPEEHAQVLFENLMHQADGATTGHAEGIPLTSEQGRAIALFQVNLATAQRNARGAGRLDARGARGGAEYLADEPFYVSINDVLGGDVVNGIFEPHSMPLFDAWEASSNPDQAAIARGAALFGETHQHHPRRGPER